MRIRKHAQMSQTCCLPSQLPSPNPCPSGSPPTRVCQLNRSPWDVMSFTLEAMIEDAVSGDENGGETSGAVESVPSSKLEGKEISWSSSSSTVVISVSGREKRNEEMKSKSRKEGSLIVCCNKTDGKGWKCKKEAKQGHSLCEHHLAQLKSYYTNSKSNNRSIFLYGEGGKSGGAPGGTANNIHRGRRSSSKTSSSNYYYYTGFGPSWGKGRGEDKKRRDTEVDYRPYPSSPPSLSSGDDDDDDDVDDDDDEDSGDDDSNFDKKRTRKPVKTRSLKSLL